MAAPDAGPAGPGAETRAAALAFLTAAVTLFVQVLVHRVVSAKLLNNYAFLVISLTMLGFALSGVLLTRWLGRYLEDLPDAVNLCSAAFTLTLLAATVVFYRAPVGSQFPATRPEFVWNFFRWAPLALLYAVPFVFSGLILGALLAAPRLRTRRVYFADLLGSALGAGLVVAAIGAIGVERGLVAGGAVQVLAAGVLFPPRRTAARAAALAALAAVGLGGTAGDRLFRLSYPPGSVLAQAAVPDSGLVVEHTAWDPLARIEVSRIRPPRPEIAVLPSLIGPRAGFHQRFRRILTQNNYAYTYAVDYDGNPETLAGIEDTIYAAAYQAGSVPAPRVLVIGVGGGFDILTALRCGALRVTGAEINGATVDVLTGAYRDYFRAWVDDPRVHIVRAEGRHFLTREAASFDVIQLSGVDSYSGTPAAAHVFSENFLYTTEAFDTYLSRLTPDGIVNMMRLEYAPPREMLRALVTAVDALRRAGALEPARHVVTFTDNTGFFTALLVKKAPFTDAELDRLEAWGARNPFLTMTASPRRNREQANMYQVFLGLADRQKEAAFVHHYPFDIAPVTDDRPFFFRHSSWRHLFGGDEAVRKSIPVMEYSVLLLSVVVGLAAVLCIYLPLRRLAAEGLKAPHAARYAVYFAGAGVGYMAVEVALLQKFGHFLGHPNYALSVVLAGLLFATGLGSLFSAHVVRALGEVRYVAYVLAAVVLLEYALVFPRLGGWVGMSFPARVFIVLALVTPVGLCLGAFVPWALDGLKERAPAFVPWAWGINGIFSVIAPVLSVGWSITWGVSALLLASLPVYLIVGWSLPAGEMVRNRT